MVIKGKIGLILICLLGFAARGQVGVSLQQLLKTDGLKNAAIGISVKRVNDGKEILAHCPDMALTPASVMKLIPTWFALQEKGEDFRFKTPVLYTGTIKDGILSGDLIVGAGGDPCPDSRYFPDHSLLSAIVAALQKSGVRQIQGRVIVEGGAVGTDIPGSWTWEDISNYYGALYLPFNYRDNTYVLQFQSGKSGTPAKLTGVTPALPGVRIRSEVRASAANKDNAWIFGGPYTTELCVRGTIPAERPDFKVKGAMHNPAVVFESELTGILKKNGITVSGKACPETGRKELLNLSSPRLEEIIYHTNKSSVNLFAEALGKLAGGDSWPDKVKVLFAGAGIEASGIMLKDACGLSPSDAVPAVVFTDLLVFAGRKNRTAFVRSLPVAGVDGGLTGYCHSFPQLKNKLKAKTGSMSGVRCLSGYITNRMGDPLAFTILINHYSCTTPQLQHAVGQFLSDL